MSANFHECTPHPKSSGWVDTSDATLNAILGDYLEQCGSALAIRMAFYHRGRPLTLSAQSLPSGHSQMPTRIVVLVPGMAQTESCWLFRDDPAVSYGTLLRDEFGFTPFYLRYNSGLHVSQNGRFLAELLERLLEAYPGHVEEITLVGHSMGGLVIRAACHHASKLELSWLHHARRAFYLGTPHLGSPFEKAGHLASIVLGAVPDPVVKLTGALGNLRSAGIKDLRHGSLLDEDWRGCNLDAFDAPPPRPVPLQPCLEHYLIAGSLTRSERHVIARLFGDGLVRLPSAVDPGCRAKLHPRHFAVLPGIHHMQLARSPAVYEVIRSCLGAPARERAATSAVELDAPAEASSVRDFERMDAYCALVRDAVHHGATAVQNVQEALIGRPYDVIAAIRPLEAPLEYARSAHLGATRRVYDSIRTVNAAAVCALRMGLKWVATKHEPGGASSRCA